MDSTARTKAVADRRAQIRAHLHRNLNADALAALSAGSED